MNFWQPLRHRVQSELVKRGHCVACTRSLATAERQPSSKKPAIQIVFCQCRRIYVYDCRINHYKRALEKEIENHLS